MIIYRTPTCSRCKLLAAAFQKAGIAYEEGELNASIIAECLCDTGELINVAPLVKDGYVWHFYDDFFDNSGNLKANWLVELKGIRPHKEFGGMGGTPSHKEQKCKSIWGNSETLK
jgi:hypothetical protein